MSRHIHRYRKLGRHGEAKICLKCGRTKWDPEEFHKSRLMQVSALAIGDKYEIFNDDEMALLKKWGAIYRKKENRGSPAT